MALFNYKGNTSRGYGGLPISKSIQTEGGSRKSFVDVAKSNPYSAGVYGDAAKSATERSVGLYDTQTYQDRQFGAGPGTKVVDGKVVPATYGSGGTGKTKKMSDVYTEQTGEQPSGGSSSSGGGTKASSGGANSGYDYSTIKSFLDEANTKYAERSSMQLDNWETALAEAEKRFSALENSPLYQSMRSTAQNLLGGELTSSQKAAVGSAMRDVSRTTGESYLARGLGGSGMATSETAGAQGLIASKTADIVRQNQLAGLEAGTALEGQYQNQLNQLMMFREGEIRPLDIQLPDYTAQAELLGRAAASSGTGTQGAGHWGILNPNRDITKGEGLKWGWIPDEAPATQLTPQEQSRAYQEDLASRRKAARG